MASSIIILKQVYNYSPEETIKTLKKAITDAGMILNKLEIRYDSNEKIIDAEGSIGFIDSKHELQQFAFTVNNIDIYSEKSFEWLVPGKNLFWAIDIEDIGEYHQQVFEFAIEYFYENTNDYLWLDSLEWAYSAKEIQKLAQIPYCSQWLYNKIV